jgi:hypothetical protein
MSQVKKLKALGIEFDDPKMWDLLEALDKLPDYLEEKKRKREERIKFVESVWLNACQQAGLVD